VPAVTDASRRRLVGAAALAGYTVVSFLFVGVRPLVESGHHFIGYGYDPQIFIWSLAWWPHAVAHGVNPFVTRAIWFPYGVDLTWSTTVPGLALLFAPLTVLAGAIVSYDVAAVLLPALAAWTAYLLCRYLTGALWPALVGGYLFGFSSYMIAQDFYGGHINLSSVFLMPLVALVVLRFLDGGVHGWGLVWRLGPLLGLQVLFSTELGLTMTAMLLGALAVAYLLAPARRPRLRALALPLLWAYLLGGLLIAPFLYYLLAVHIPPPFYSGLSSFDADLANIVVPTKLSIGGGTLLGGVSSRFLSNLPEEGFYLGLPTIAIITLYLRRRRRSPAGRFLLAAFALTILAALGSQVTVAGRGILPLPYRYLTSYPVFDNLLTGRLIVYTWLAAAVTVALWTAARRPGALRIVLPALAAVSIAPNLAHSGLATSYELPQFFTASAYRGCLDPGETVLPFPSRGAGHALLWQVASGFRFNLTTGDIGPNKPQAMFPRFSVDPVPGGLPLGVGDAGTLRTFLAGRGVTSIVVDATVANSYVGAVDQIAPPHVVGGVYLYHLTAFAPSCLGG
jgi:hypothetical protein